MKRIGLTQRVEVIASYGERRDCLDQNWTRLLSQAGMLPLPLPNVLDAPEAFLDAMNLDGVILTGGNDLAHLPNASQPAPERDAFEKKILDWAGSKPVLGVCRGAQVMAAHYGATLSPVKEHVARRHAVRIETEIFRGLPPEPEVNSFHGWGLEESRMPECLRIAARAADGTVEGFVHATLPRAAVMWHPERERPFRDAEVRWIRSRFGMLSENP